MVMTNWFKGCGVTSARNQQDKQKGKDSKGKGIMGAAGSSQQHQHHSQALNKSRSQSSSALFEGKPNPSSSTNGGTGNITATSSSMWDIPQTSNASPRHRPHPKDKRALLMNMKGTAGKGNGNSKGRSKLYAVSCPDVAQQAALLNNQQPHPLTEFSPISEDSALFILPPPEGYRNGNHLQQQHVHQHQHQANCPLSREQKQQPQPLHIYPIHQHLPYPVGVGGAGLSMSYQHLPSSYFIQQYPLMQQVPNNHFHHHQQPHHHMSQGALPTRTPVAEVKAQARGRGSLPNQRSCDFPLGHNENLDPQQISAAGDSSINGADIDSIFPSFVIPENIFEVHLKRDQRGLGLSVTGGRDSKEKFAGLIRIKKVFPMSPASDSGRISAWDVALMANGIPLTGLTNIEALSVLRTTPTTTILTLCRPPPGTPGFSDPVPPTSQANNSDPHFPYNSYNPHHHHNHILPQQKSKSLSSLKIPQAHSEPRGKFGEFEVTLEKVAGSLGFTLRQEDSSILGHYVRALVKEPALTDGRIQPGDRIISVNDQDLSEMSHSEAISFLRQCPPTVTLRLWRDTSPTPVSPLSPSESHKEIKPKPLRQEAIAMLNDLHAQRKQNSHSVSLVGGLRQNQHQDSSCPATLPRRRGHHHQGLTPSPQVLSAALKRFAQPTSSKSSSLSVPQPHPISGQEEDNDDMEERSSGSGESTPMKGKNLGDPYRAYHDLRSDSIVSATSTIGENERETGNNDRRCTSFRQNDSETTPSFQKGQPKYQSAIIPGSGAKKKFIPLRVSVEEDHQDSSKSPQNCDETPLPSLKGKKGFGGGSSLSSSSSSGSKGPSNSTSLLKWKGVLLEDQDDDDEENGTDKGLEVESSNSGSDVALSHRNFLGVDRLSGEGQRRSPDGREFRDCDVEISATTQENGEQIFTVQLSRRWCSRLGFSLQGKEGRTYISAIYPDSVAAKDGRLRVGDEVVMVNGETIRDLQTSQVIDMMRKTRGIISVTLLRKSEPLSSGSGSDSELGLR